MSAPRASPVRQLPFDAETHAILDAAVGLLSFRRGYLFGDSRRNVARLALLYARSTGMRPNGIAMTGRPLKVDTAGLYDDYRTSAVSALVASVMRRYVEGGLPTSAVLDSRAEPVWLNAPCSLLPALGVRALAAKRTAEVEAVAVLERAMHAEIAAMEATERIEGAEQQRLGFDETLLVGFRLDPGLHARFREMAGRFGYDADTLLWRAAREEMGKA